MAINLQQIANKQERSVFRAFMETVQSVKDQAVISEIAQLINVGNVEGIVNLLQLDPATFRPLENAVAAAYETGGATGAAQIGRIPAGAGTLVARFNVRDPRAEEWLRTLSSTRIVEIADDTRNVVRTVLRESMAVGAGPRTTALDLVGRIDPVTRSRVGGYIGLTDQQASWVVNARRDLETLNPNYLTRALRDRRLDSAFMKAMETGKPLTAKQIDTAVSRYQARALRYRAETIARTESLQALTEGQNEAIRQALQSGELEDEFTLKFWDATGDSRTRPEHTAVEAEYSDGIPFDQPFIVGGERMMYPRQAGASAGNVINCRCRLKTRVNFAGQAAKTIQGFG